MALTAAANRFSCLCLIVFCCSVAMFVMTVRSVAVRSIVGCAYDRVKKTIVLHTYPMPEAGCCGAGTDREYQRVVLSHSDAGVLDRWDLAFAQLLAHWNPNEVPNGLRPPRRKLLVLVNPFGGKGTAARVCAAIEPVLAHSGAEVTKLETQRAGHAHEIARDFKPGSYDSVVLVSGDGLISEFVNGLFDRADWRQAIASLTIGVVPGGSGNGLAKTLLTHAGETFSAVNAAFLVVKGVPRKVDIFTVTPVAAAGGGGGGAKPKKPFIGFLSAQWAIASDVDFESEKWRSCCGGARFTWTAIVRMCCLRHYSAQIEYLPAPDITLHKPNWSTRKTPLPEYEKCTGSECKVCLPRSPVTPQSPASAAAAVDEKSPAAAAAGLFPESSGVDEFANFWSATAAAGVAPAPEAEKDKWQKQTGDEYVMVWAMNTTHPSYDMFGAPMAHLSEYVQSRRRLSAGTVSLMCCVSLFCLVVLCGVWCVVCRVLQWFIGFVGGSKHRLLFSHAVIFGYRNRFTHPKHCV